VRVCVTGGTGYLGRAICRAMADLDLHVIARRPAAVVAGQAHRWGDVRRQILDLAPDRVVHLACHYGHEPRVLQRVNIELAEEVASTGVPMVYADSVHAFGANGSPINAYGASRRAFADEHPELTRLVVHETYGPGDDRARLVPTLLTAWRDGGLVALAQDGGPMDLVHVDDAAAAFRTALGLGPGTWSVRTGESMTPIAIHAELEHLLGPIQATVLPFGRPGLKLPIRQAAVPGWSPRATHRGLRELAERARDQRDAYAG